MRHVAALLPVHGNEAARIDRDAGALGARLTGAGFGGCVVALVADMQADKIARTAVAEYTSRTGRTPTAWVVHPAAGAGVLS